MIVCSPGKSRGGCLSTPGYSIDGCEAWRQYLDTRFDGDQLNLMYAVDGKMADAWEVFAPEYNIFLMDKPHEASGNMSLTKPIVMSGGAWMDAEE